MIKYLTGLCFCLLLSGLFSCIKEPPQQEHPKQKKVEAALEKIRKDFSDSLGFQVPSISVLIQTPMKKLFVSSAAPAAQPMTPNTHFRFASNSKNFTATAILNMWEDGWLDYKAKITDIVPESKDFTYVPLTPDWDFPNKNEITIEQLLQHSAGVYDIDNDPVPGYGGMSYVEYIKENDPTHQFSVDDMVKVLQDKVLPYFAPGTGYHYSNTGYAILSEIIKRVYSYKAGTPKTYADYLEDYVIGGYARVPLKKVHFPVLATDVSLPAPYVTSTVLLPNGIRRYDQLNVSGHVGEGNGIGTMDDLNTYVRTLMKGQNVLQPATVQLMQKSVSAANGSYGLGCAFWNNLGYGHNGAIAGYLSLMVYDPVYDVSLIAMMPLWDLRDDLNSFEKCLLTMYDAAYTVRRTLGYPG